MGKTVLGAALGAAMGGIAAAGVVSITFALDLHVPGWAQPALFAAATPVARVLSLVLGWPMYMEAALMLYVVSILVTVMLVCAFGGAVLGGVVSRLGR